MRAFYVYISDVYMPFYRIIITALLCNYLFSMTLKLKWRYFQFVHRLFLFAKFVDSNRPFLKCKLIMVHCGLASAQAMPYLAT